MYKYIYFLYARKKNYRIPTKLSVVAPYLDLQEWKQNKDRLTFLFYRFLYIWEFFKIVLGIDSESLFHWAIVYPQFFLKFLFWHRVLLICWG